MGCLKRIAKEVRDLGGESALALYQQGISPAPRDDDPRVWDVVIEGPEGSPYEGGRFHVTLRFTDNYPFQPPKIAFKTPIWHRDFNLGIFHLAMRYAEQEAGRPLSNACADLEELRRKHELMLAFTIGRHPRIVDSVVSRQRLPNALLRHIFQIYATEGMPLSKIPPIVETPTPVPTLFAIFNSHFSTKKSPAVARSDPLPCGITIAQIEDPRKVFTLEVDGTDTFATIKAKLEKLEGVPVEKQKLIYSEMKTKDINAYGTNEFKTLRSLGITEGSQPKTLHWLSRAFPINEDPFSSFAEGNGWNPATQGRHVLAFIQETLASGELTYPMNCGNYGIDGNDMARHQDPAEFDTMARQWTEWYANERELYVKDLREDSSCHLLGPELRMGLSSPP